MTGERLAASSADLLRASAEIAEDWLAVDATGAFLARNIDTGEHFGFEVDEAFPLASVAKVPLSLVILDAVERGELDGSRELRIEPTAQGIGPTGLATFRHPVTIAIDDLVAQALTVSDNVAADALLGVVGIASVNARLAEWGAQDIIFRHSFARMYDVARGVTDDDFALAMELAIAGAVPGGQHPIETLDPARSNAASAASIVRFLERSWLGEIGAPRAVEQLRGLMMRRLITYRLSSDLRSDSIRIAAKTGSFLNLRHEVGVVETDDGARIAMAAFTRSGSPAMTQQALDLAIGAAARTAVELLR